MEQIDRERVQLAGAVQADVDEAGDGLGVFRGDELVGAGGLEVLGAVGVLLSVMLFNLNHVGR